MRIIGLLNWYEEPASWLAECVASAAKLCDHLIAVDGPYAKFPGALSRTASGSEQADVITHTAAGAGIGCTVHVHNQPWWGNEVEKRDWMFRLAGLVATAEDWLLVIDADEVLSIVPPDTRELLQRSEFDVAELKIWDNEGTQTLDRRLLRAIPGLRVEGAHYVWTAPDGAGGKKVLRGSQSRHKLAPAESLWDLRLEHRQRHRNTDRQSAKREYYSQIYDIEHLKEIS